MEYFYNFVIIFFFLLLFFTFIISYNELKVILKKNNFKFETAIDDLSTSIDLLKDREESAIKQREALNFSIHGILTKQNELSNSIHDLDGHICKLSEKVEDVENKLGLDLEYYADSVLVRLTGLTTLEDLKLYLNQKRSIIVKEAKRLLTIGINNLNEAIVESSWNDMRINLYDTAVKISPELRDYMQKSIHLREDKLKRYKNTLLNAIEHGNGSKDKIFISEIKEYIKKQLEFTFKDYQDYRSNINFEKSIDINQKNIEYFRRLIVENKIDKVFKEMECFLIEKKNSDLLDRLIICNAQYNEYKEKKEMNMPTDINLPILNKTLINLVNLAFTINN